VTIYSTITFVGDPLFASGRGRKNPFPLATVVEPLKAPSHSAKGTHLRGDALTVPTIRRVVVVPPRPSIRIFSLMSILTLRYPKAAAAPTAATAFRAWCIPTIGTYISTTVTGDR
jgi:hypothetical protein